MSCFSFVVFSVTFLERRACVRMMRLAKHCTGESLARVTRQMACDERHYRDLCDAHARWTGGPDGRARSIYDNKRDAACRVKVQKCNRSCCFSCLLRLGWTHYVCDAHSTAISHQQFFVGSFSVCVHAKSYTIPLIPRNRRQCINNSGDRECSI